MHRPEMNPAGFYRRIPLQPHQLTERLTPTKDVIVLCHLGVPQVARDDWSLSIDGLVARAVTIGFEELARYPKHRVTSIHQCAGSPLVPTEPARRITNVTWGGVRLRDVWTDGPRTYLGQLVDGFPNLLMVLGPHTARGNIPRAIEHSVEWQTGLLRFMRERNYVRVQTRPEYVEEWTLDDGDYEEWHAAARWLAPNGSFG